MLIDFSITNFRSIKEKQVFSMQPIGKVKELIQNTFSENKKQFLSSCIIYGGNASGKSNLLKAMKALEFLVAQSGEFKNNQKIAPYEPYKLEYLEEEKPVELEINFIAKDKMRYNYAISYNRDAILQESLFYYPTIKPAKIFSRLKDQNIQVGETLGVDISNIEEKLFPNQLFLSKSSNENIKSLTIPYTFLTRHFFVHTFHSDRVENDVLRKYTKAIHNDSTGYFKNNVNQVVHLADLGINNITIKENKEEDFKFPKELDEKVRENFIKQNKHQIRTNHDVYKDGKVFENIDFAFEQESTGTQKFLALGSIIIDGLSDGDVIVIDELDKSLHPMLTKALINLFHSKKTNPNNAQLIFASHDVSLLSSKIFRRDQIYFAEKNIEGSSRYFSLGEITGVRKGISYEKYYMEGAFGGTPVINEFFLNFNAIENEKQ